MKAIKFFNMIATPIIIFFPFLLVTGPFVPDLFASILGIFFLFLIFSKKIEVEFNRNYLYFFIFFFIIFILSSILSDQIYKSLKSSLFYFRFLIFSMIIIFLIKNNNKILKNIFLCLTSLFILLILDSYSEFFFKKNFLNYIPTMPGRIASLFGDELVIGGYITRFFFIYFFLVKIISPKNNFYFLIIILLYILIFISGERAAFIQVNFGLFIYFIFNLKDISQISLKRVLLISIIPFFIFFTLNNNLKYRYFDLTINTFKSIKEKNLYDEIFFNFYISKKIVKENYIIGSGPRSYLLKCKKITQSVNTQNLQHLCRSHPHNYYIQLLAETGLLGVCFLLIPFVFILIFIFREFIIFFKNKIYVNQLNIILLISVFLNLWPITTTGNFFSNWLSYSIYFSLGLFLAKTQFFNFIIIKK